MFFSPNPVFFINFKLVLGTNVGLRNLKQIAPLSLYSVNYENAKKIIQ